MRSTRFLAGSLAAASQIFGALALRPDSVVNIPNVVERQSNRRPVQSPSAIPVPGAITSLGCWDSRANTTASDLRSNVVSSGSCREWCEEQGFTVFALQGANCYGGLAMPSEDHKVDDTNCNYPCPAFPLEICGSGTRPHYYSWVNIGVEIDPPIYEDEEAEETSSSAAPSSSATQTTQPSATETDESDGSDDGGPNVAGIAAGSVVGVVAIAGIAAGLWFFMRRRRNSEIEEEHRRNAAVNAFISGSKPPGSSGSISMTDSRLDPVMAHRRLSDGSIADNEDYSRKILRVTNA